MTTPLLCHHVPLYIPDPSTEVSTETTQTRPRPIPQMVSTTSACPDGFHVYGYVSTTGVGCGPGHLLCLRRP